MPYEIRRKGSRYQVVNTETGEAKSNPTTKRKAENQLKILKQVERKWTPTDEPDTYTRTVNGRTARLKIAGGKRGA